MSKARELAELGAVYDSGALSNRNMIINGAMQIAQRATQSTNASSTGYKTLDRYYHEMKVNTDNFTYTTEQVSDAPSGFSKSFKLTCTTAETALASDEYGRIYQAIEGNNLERVGFGTADAKTLTVSFYVKSSLTGNFSVSLYLNDANVIYSQAYTINAANTWERKTLNIPAYTTAGPNIDNTQGAILNFGLFAGSGHNTATSNWTSYSTTNLLGGQTASLAGTINATWQITGLQLEVGSEATPFEHRSYGDELARCQRYFQKYNYSNNLSDGATANTLPVNCCYTTTIAYGGSKLTQEMRTSPTFSASAAGTWVFYTASSSYTSADMTAYETGPFMWGMKYETSGSWTAGNAVYGRPTGTSSYYQFDAEL